MNASKQIKEIYEKIKKPNEDPLSDAHRCLSAVMMYLDKDRERTDSILHEIVKAMKPIGTGMYSEIRKKLDDMIDGQTLPAKTEGEK